jgi:homoserine kinase type II
MSPATTIEQTPDSSIARVLQLWNVPLGRVRRDIDLTGSPERTEFRTAVEDTAGNLFVLERIGSAKCDHRRRISAVLFLLAERQVPALHPYLRTRREATIGECDGAFWQLMPFVEGVPLPRPAYIHDRWRGDAAGDFLLALRQASQVLPPVRNDVFSIIDYMDRLMTRFESRMPRLARELKPIRTFVAERLKPIHDTLPVAFCHGDFHPLNIIWGEDRINSVIDWEFMGYKPELFDVANIVGCIGMEQPDALLDGFAPALAARLRKTPFAEDVSWLYLLDYIIALRFGWMREWVYRTDEEMINLELDYMFLLIDNHDAIAQALG